MNQDNITPSILRFTRVSSSSFTSFQSPWAHLYRFESTALPRSQNAPWWNRTHQFQWWPLRLVRHSLRYESVVPDPRHASLEGPTKKTAEVKKNPKKHLISSSFCTSGISYSPLESRKSKCLKKWWVHMTQVNALKHPSPRLRLHSLVLARYSTDSRVWLLRKASVALTL